MIQETYSELEVCALLSLATRRAYVPDSTFRVTNITEPIAGTVTIAIQKSRIGFATETLFQTHSALPQGTNEVRYKIMPRYFQGETVIHPPGMEHFYSQRKQETKF